MTCMLLALALLAAAPLHQQRSDDARVRQSVLEIDAVFLDRSGSPVQNISRDDVEVWVAGYRVPLEKFMAVTPEDQDRSRRHILLLLDDITVPPALIPRAREAAHRLVDRLTAGDQMAVIMLSGSTTKSTDDKGALRRTIDAYNPRATGITRFDQLGEQVLNTITDVSRQVAESPGRRRTIVGIGSGWVFDTPLPPPTAGRELGPEWVAAMRAMAFANVSLYVIDPAGVGRSPLPSGEAGFARETGGFAFMNTNDMAGAADRIMNEASTYYILVVADPPMFRTAPLRELDVRVKRRGIKARARRGIPGAPPAPAR